MKNRIVTAVFCFIFFWTTLCTVCCTEDNLTQNEEIARAPFVVGLIGDSHISQYENTINWFCTSIDDQLALSGGIDVLAMTGDIIYQENPDCLMPERYDKALTALSDRKIVHAPATEEEIPFVYAMGNHEFSPTNQNAALSKDAIALFTQKTGQPPNYHTVVKGYHFIVGHAEGFNNQVSAQTESYLMTEIDAAIAQGGSNRPVFVLLHPPVPHLFGKNYGGYSEAFLQYLETKPQVIFLTAHTHVSAQLPQILTQKGFTAYQTPLTGGAYLATAPLTDTEPKQRAHQGAILTVDENNVVKIYHFDLKTKEFLKAPYVLDIPAMVEDTTRNGDAWRYTPDKLAQPALKRQQKDRAAWLQQHLIQAIHQYFYQTNIQK